MHDWVEKSLGELTAFISKGIPPKYIDAEGDNSIRVLNQKCNRGFQISYADSRLHDNSQKRVSEEKLLRKFDVLINSTGTGTAGRVAQVWDVPEPTTFDGHMILLRANSDIDPLYYGYAIKSFQSQIEELAEGSTGQTEINRQRLLDEIVIRFPRLLEKQRFIANTLKSLDKRILCNRAINQNLLQQAGTVFDHWFGRYFGESVIPDGWKISELSDLDVLITDYVANGSFKSLADNVEYLDSETNNVLIRLTDYNNAFNSDMVYISDSAYDFLSKSKLFGDEIVISNVGANVGTVFRCPRLNKRMSLAPNAIMIRSELYEHYLFLLFTSRYGQNLLQSIVTGSAQPKFNKTNFRSLKILIPDKKTLTSFNAIYSPINEMMVQNNKENRLLSSLRDSLLPKLMSGELDVSEIDI